MAEAKLYFLMAKLLKLDYYIVTINNISIGLCFTSDYTINTIGNLGFGVEIVAFAVIKYIWCMNSYIFIIGPQQSNNSGIRFYYCKLLLL